MGRLRKRLKDENGAVMLIEAVFIYPIVFLAIFFLIYVGLFILQYMSVSAYAQKVALLASREVAYPGYINLVSKDVYTTSAVEADLGTDAEGNTINSFSGKVTLNFDPKKAQVNAYRYWGDPLSSESKTVLVNILKEMVKKNSIIGAGGDVKATVEAENYFVTQYVKVSVSQPLASFPVLDAFGIEQPTVSATVQASVNDTDELVRNVDFAVDAIRAIAKKLGIDTDNIKQKFKEAKEFLGL